VKMKGKISLIVLLLVAAVEKAASNCCKDPNEEYTDCGPACGSDGCNENRYIAECSQRCAAGCFCKCGYFRNSAGQCVTADQCPSLDNYNYPKLCPGQQCCGNYEYYSESNACVDRCRAPGGPQVLCINSKIPGCYCLPGYKRSLINTTECIPVNQCAAPQPVCNGLNEEVGCKPCQSCAVVQAKAKNQTLACEYLCPAVPTGCRCKDGYYKDSNGNCVTEAQCLAPKCTGPNEELGCGLCQTCAYYKLKLKCLFTCIPALQIHCACKPGYYRDNTKNNVCVLGSECPDIQVMPKS